MATIMQQGAEDIEVLRLGAISMGPIEATLMKALIVFNRGPFTDKRYGILNVLPRSPESSDMITNGVWVAARQRVFRKSSPSAMALVFTWSRIMRL
jgi:hypothetical protein